MTPKIPAPKGLRRVSRKLRKTGQFEWRLFWRARPLEETHVLYESFAGNGVLCNPEAIFRGLLEDSRYAHLHHIWVISDDEAAGATMREFARHPRVRFVQQGSPSYHRALATAKYLVNNATFPPDFGKREGQVYVNTWHGTPLKTMGYDEPEGGPNARNVIRNLLSADYLLASSPFMAEQMYESSYRLTNVFSGEIVTEGAPRVDRQHLDASERLRVLARLRASGIPLEQGQKIVLYAPTWRGQSFHSPSNDAAALGQRVRRLRAQLPPDHIVLLKVHQQAYGFALEQPDLRDTLVPNEIPTNVVLGVTDVLVNDYSSVFFDFLSTGRPIIFFTPDLRDYEGYRGLYLAPDELPGPVVSRIPELARLVVAAGSGDPEDPLVSHREAYDTVRGRFAPKDDGHATERVIDIIFGGKRRGYDVRPARHDGRRRILIYLGGMRSNGITTSAINLLNNIDHDRFDVTAFYTYSRNADQARNAAAIHPRVRVIPRVGGMTPSKRHKRDRNRLLELGMNAPGLDVPGVTALFRDEWRRCFGEASFDHIIDFSGYAAFWSFLLLQGEAASHSIWLHNDLKADQEREVDGRRAHEANLRGVFSTYAGYDHLVSVSKALMEINARKLTEVDDPEKHTYARNTINDRRITTMAHGLDGGSRDRDDSATIPVTPLPTAVAELARSYGLDAIEAEVQRRRTVDTVLPEAPGVTTFVTVGRLSPEKNHARLIRAFDAVHQEHPATRLVIVGSGPLQEELQSLALGLGLARAVILAGHQNNPFAILAESDCFVLSSDYEGQPMVILEALVLGLPVVSTDFASVGGALPENVGLVVDRSVEALAGGMRRALAGEVPKRAFDATAYNQEAVEEFYRAIGVPAAHFDRGEPATSSGDQSATR
ncbi:glycosyltransferase [Segeticoccus rhizosphaerae]|uniref:glycosyltransferase n=1 Tax=Segeticoccus rhizosphaerae TaxID=1104777 RepID=UPI0013906250|nr:glycosyltransferase [Ornithinicoccus soli]